MYVGESHLSLCKYFDVNMLPNPKSLSAMIVNDYRSGDAATHWELPSLALLGGDLALWR